ncbi:3'-5' ssDNA/RNA exonuclease TatD [Elysia marginata]|uniref:3'-5' ssDNA/RNA exonuclease TatD n=1 Tax=Elysia marginata TaxID=1093978 RepID=A0AAV4EEE1_9GAST|nr:3'-5' ssDNA/RNA exonuclease TatD [Elysia marginata]
MEDLPQGRTFNPSTRQKPDTRSGARYKSENVQGPKRIFQISLGRISAKKNNGKTEKDTRDNLSQMRSGKNSFTCEQENRSKPDTAHLSESSVIRRGISGTLNLAGTLPGNKTLTPSSKISSRGRGRLMRLKASAPGELSSKTVSGNDSESNSTLSNIESSPPNAEDTIEQEQIQTPIPEPRKNLHLRDNLVVASELPDLIKCQSEKEKTNQSECEVSSYAAREAIYDSDSSFVDADPGDKNVLLNNSKPAVTMTKSRAKYHDKDSSSSGCEDTETKRPPQKPTKHSTKMSVQAKKSSPQITRKKSRSYRNLKRSSPSKLEMKDKENPRQKWSKSKSDFEKIRNADSSVSCQSIRPPKPNENSPEKPLIEKTNIEDWDMEIAVKVDKNVKESAHILLPVDVRDQSKGTKHGLVAVPQDEGKTMDLEKNKGKLDCVLGSGAFVQEPTEKTLVKVEKIKEQSSQDSNMLCSSVCEKVAALYHSFQTEDDTKKDHLTKSSESERAERKKMALKILSNQGDKETASPEIGVPDVSDESSLERNTELTRQGESLSKNIKNNQDIQSLHNKIEKDRPPDASNASDVLVDEDVQKKNLNLGKKCETFDKEYNDNEQHHMKNQQSNRKETKPKLTEIMSVALGGKRTCHKNEKKMSELECIEENDRSERIGGIEYCNDSGTTLQVRDEISDDHMVGRTPPCSEYLSCALKLQNVSISDDRHGLDDEMFDSFDKDNQANQICTVGRENHLADVSRTGSDKPQMESLDSSDFCPRSLSDFVNSNPELSSEPEVELDSQSESELVFPKQDSFRRSRIHSQDQPKLNSSELRVFDYQQHPPIDTHIQGFADGADDTFSDYPNEEFFSYSDITGPVGELSMPTSEFNRHNEQVPKFLKFCSDKINNVVSNYQGYGPPLAVKIKVELVCPYEQSTPYSRKPEERARFSHAGYSGPHLPPAFSHPDFMCYSHGAWQEYLSHPYIGASWTDVRKFHSQPDYDQHGSRNFQPRPPYMMSPHPLVPPPGLNPQMYSYRFANYRPSPESMKRAYEAGQTAAELNEPPTTLNSTGSPLAEDDENSASQKEYWQTLKATPNKYSSSYEADNRNSNNKNASSSVTKDRSKNRTRTPQQAFGMSAFLTAKRLHNAMDEVQRAVGPRTDLQDQLDNLKYNLKRTSSNPEVNKSAVSTVGLDSSSLKKKKQHRNISNESAQSHTDTLYSYSKSSSSDDFNALPKRLKSVSDWTNGLKPGAAGESSDHAWENGHYETEGHINDSSSVSLKPLPYTPNKALMGSDCPNWREHCKPLGNVDPSSLGLPVQFGSASKYRLKRRSDCAWEVQRNGTGDSKPQTTILKGLKGRRSDPGGGFQASTDTATTARRERWLTSFKHRSGGYPLPFIDTHCHIDFLYSRLGESSSTPFHKFREENHRFFPTNYGGCVAVFCNPKTFVYPNPRNEVLKMCEQEDDVWLAIGCHPKNAEEFYDCHLYGLRMALQSPKVVALGEIGLDYSGHFYKHAETQKRVFIQQLNLALDLQLPIVIHCREADDDCLNILQQIVPRDHKIHAHCFTRSLAVAQRWMDAFTNLWLGFTPLISYKSAVDVIESSTHVPLERILLETDAPYFVPGSLRDANVQYSYPGFALCTAETMALNRGIPVSEVLKACRKNTKDMYGI